MREDCESLKSENWYLDQIFGAKRAAKSVFMSFYEMLVTLGNMPFYNSGNTTEIRRSVKYAETARGIGDRRYIMRRVH
jgi:hypothetical protein